MHYKYVYPRCVIYIVLFHLNLQIPERSPSPVVKELTDVPPPRRIEPPPLPEACPLEPPPLPEYIEPVILT